MRWFSVCMCWDYDVVCHQQKRQRGSRDSTDHLTRSDPHDEQLQVASADDDDDDTAAVPAVTGMSARKRNKLASASQAKARARSNKLYCICQTPYDETK